MMWIMTRTATPAAEIGLATAVATQDRDFAGSELGAIVSFGQGNAPFKSARFIEPCFATHLPGTPEISVIDGPTEAIIETELANRVERSATTVVARTLFGTSSTAVSFMPEIEARAETLTHAGFGIKLSQGGGIAWKETQARTPEIIQYK